MITLAAHFAQIGELPVLEPLRVRLRAIEEARHSRCRQKSVVFSFERSQLLAPNIGTATRHHHRRVPAQERQRAAEGVQAPEFLFQLLIR